jgi:hypothetical protein
MTLHIDSTTIVYVVILNIASSPRGGSVAAGLPVRKLVVSDGEGPGGGAEQHQPCGVDPET